MICRGGILGSAGMDAAPFLRAGGVPEITSHPRPVSWLRMLVAVVIVAAVLAALPGRTRIAPLVESDYCYQFIAADRMLEGHGLTCPKPVAPFQPWEWTGDWAFLTNWPAGYSLLIVALRKVFNLTSLDAARCINIAACATALVAWFMWTRRVVPRGLAGLLLSAVAAGCAVSVGFLVNPSTDAILVALLPLTMLLTIRGVERAERQTAAFLPFGVAGLFAGGLFWVRYASVFVPAAIALFLLLHWRWDRKVRIAHVLAFVFAAAVPVLSLVIINRVFGSSESSVAQLNLGRSAGFDFTWSRFAQAWWMFTDLGYYSHHRVAHWVFALWPIAVVAIGLRSGRAAGALRSYLSKPAVSLSLCVMLSALAMLVAASTLFQRKFDYVELERYYIPIRPLYFGVFAAPILLVTYRMARAAACVMFALAACWTMQQEWSRTYDRWLHAERAVSPYGQWSKCFEPGAAALFGWLRAQTDPELVVISNFHEYVTLETGIAALPIPQDQAILDQWLRRIREVREVAQLRVLFVLDPDNKWRSHWIPDLDTVVDEFGLVRLAARREAPGYVYVLSEESIAKMN